MDRIKNAELMNFFMHFCKDMNKAAMVSPSDLKAVKEWATEYWTIPCEIVPYGTVGAWRLDHAGCYGGWQIQEMDNAGGGISCPMGYHRFRSRQMYDMICFARAAIRLRGLPNVKI